MVRAYESLKRFGKSYEADGKSTVSKYLHKLIVRFKLIGIKPESLTHKERIVINLPVSLNKVSVIELVKYKVDFSVKLFKENVDISVCLYGNPRQVYRGKRKVSSSAYLLTCGVVYIGHYTCTAAHVSDMSIVVALFVILKVIR